VTYKEKEMKHLEILFIIFLFFALLSCSSHKNRDCPVCPQNATLWTLLNKEEETTVSNHVDCFVTPETGKTYWCFEHEVSVVWHSPPLGTYLEEGENSGE